MNLRIKVLVTLLYLFAARLPSQELNDQVLMTVDGRDVTAGEFIRMYLKSSEPGKHDDLDRYLEQFVLFKLKVADAIREGYDTTKAFRTELQGYRNQLAENYLTDSEVKERLLGNAYQRSLTEINAWHILITLPPDSPPDDTLKAWKKAMNIRERIVQGESFEQVARSSSDDPSVKYNSGNLGYFTVFQMVTPFEDAVFSMKKGQISEPVRTPYGYHIIKVADKRPAGGKVRVAHIMKTVPPGATEKTAREAEDTIRSVYQKLMSGASFSDMVSKYSDHRESAARGGELPWFGAGEIISDFAEAALSLKNNGDISPPVRTIHGWHIIRRIDRKPHGSYEENRQYLESRLNETYLNSESRKSLVEKLKKEYKYRLNQASYNWFIENTDTSIIKGISRYDRRVMPGGPIYTFNGQQLSTSAFARYIEKRSSGIATNDPKIFISSMIEAFVSDQILAYENTILEKKYPEFRYLMNEFHDGILLFEISGRKVWNRSQDDSAGIRAYYEEHKNDRLSRESIEGKIYRLNREGGMKKLVSAYRKFSKYPDADSRMTEKFIIRNDTLLDIKNGKWHRGDDEILDSLDWKTGVHQAYMDKMPSLVVIEKTVPPVPLPFSEVQGEMMQGYQDFLEKEWTGQLKKKYDVKIDKQVLEQVKKKVADG